MKLAILYKTDTKENVRFWKIWTKGNKIYREYGLVDGKAIKTEPIICNSKNIGKVNETTPKEQAEAEARSMWTKKIEREKYSENQEEGRDIKQVMLAQVFKSDTLEYPVYVQPKLDGVRCKMNNEDGEIKAISRRENEFTFLTHIKKEIKKLLNHLPEETIIDGELYHHKLGFQKIISIVKQQKEPKKEEGELEYIVYDMITGGSYKKRYSLLKDAFSKDEFKSIRLLETEEVSSDEELLEKHISYEKKGYEGLIVRLKKGKYEPGKRSKNLLKLKSVDEEEGTIIGGVGGIGKDKDAVTFTVEDKDKIRFDCRPVGTLEEREKWLKDIKNIIGKKLTFEFRGRTDDGKPRFPVGKAIRDYE